MKKQNILISLLAIFALVGCTNNNQPGKTSKQEGGTSAQQGGDENIPTFKIEGFKTAKFEAEEFNTDYWQPDSCYDGDVVEESKASGGAYLAAGDPDSAGAYSAFLRLQ